jgi:hypothetical protein
VSRRGDKEYRPALTFISFLKLLSNLFSVYRLSMSRFDITILSRRTLVQSKEGWCPSGSPCQRVYISRISETWILIPASSTSFSIFTGLNQRDCGSLTQAFGVLQEVQRCHTPLIIIASVILLYPRSISSSNSQRSQSRPRSDHTLWGGLRCLLRLG